MNYEKFQYLYPPRPSFKTGPAMLLKYDNGEYIAQPKYNGSACLVFTNGIDFHVWNRHKAPLKVMALRWADMAPKVGSWYVFAGEYLNKSKLDENGQPCNGKFIVWDILVHEGKYLIGQTTSQRLELIKTIFPCHNTIVTPSKFEMYKHLCCTHIDGIYTAPVYYGNFVELYLDITKTDLYEGIVLKKANSKLTYGFQSLNNADWQVKCRKETKLYKF